MVNATSGTTVLGAFDPIEEIADICEKYKIWLHVDVNEFINLFILHSHVISIQKHFVFP